MNIFQELIDLESDDNHHIGRILILIYVFSKDGTVEMKGITKLAKLDFLLRYPLYLERALLTRDKSMKKGQLKEYERKSVESKMIRYKYGPWDFRYRRFLNTLVGMGLIRILIDGRTVLIAMTEKGVTMVRSLKDDPLFEDIFDRAQLLRSNFNYGASKLKDFIYQTFPEISSLSFGQNIDYEN